MPPPRRAAPARAEEAKALERARDLPNARTASDVDALKRAFADHLQYSQGKDEHTATALDRYFALAYAVRDRLMRRWIADAAGLLQARRQAGLLPLARVPHRPGAREQPARTSALYDAMRAGARGPRPRPRRPARAGARRRPRQRRPRPARRLLPRLAGDARPARPTATASATSSASSTRRSATATRSSAPTSGCASATLGDRAPRVRGAGAASTAAPSTTRTSDGRHRVALGRRAATCSACPTTRPSPATATTP